MARWQSLRTQARSALSQGTSLVAAESRRRGSEGGLFPVEETSSARSADRLDCCRWPLTKQPADGSHRRRRNLRRKGAACPPRSGGQSSRRQVPRGDALSPAPSLRPAGLLDGGLQGSSARDGGAGCCHRAVCANGPLRYGSIFGRGRDRRGLSRLLGPTVSESRAPDTDQKSIESEKWAPFK
jgi:hypothetical protein